MGEGGEVMYLVMELLVINRCSASQELIFVLVWSTEQPLSCSGPVKKLLVRTQKRKIKEEKERKE